MTFNDKIFLKNLDNIFVTTFNNTFKESSWDEISNKNPKFKKLCDLEKISINIYNKKEIDWTDPYFLNTIKEKNLSIALQENKKSGNSIIVISKLGKPVLIDGRWDNIQPYPIKTKKNIYFNIFKENKVGFIDIKGKNTIKPIYNNVSSHNNIIKPIFNKYFWIKKGDNDYNYGLITTEGKELSDFNYFMSGYDFFKWDKKEYIKVKTLFGENVIVIHDNKKLFKENFKKITLDTENKVFITKNYKNLYGIYNKDNTILENKYSHINKLIKDNFQLNENNVLSVFNLNNQEIFIKNYNKLIDINENYIIYDKNKEIHKILL